jgi:Ca2+-binding RTX toxin-like protein
MAGNPVGASITIDDPANTVADTHTLHSAAGIDDGRILVGYQDAVGDVSAAYLDTRQPGVPIIGPRNGALRDVAVGTVGDDSMDGRGLDDELYGGLGNDLITLGTGNDIGDGGLGNDTIIGGAGQDILIGGSGDDLLVGGSSGPADPKIDTILTSGLAATLVEANANGGLSNTGLTVAQINAFTANNPGADMVSGGAGIDTITMQGEFGDFKINLATAVVESDRDLNGSFILEDVIGNVVDNGAGGQIFQFSADIENATGSFGDDLIIGNDNDNVIDVGGGSNTVDGAGGLADRMIIHAKQTDLLINFDNTTQTYTFIKPAAGTSPERIQIAKNVEFFTFVDDTGAELDTTATGVDLIPGPIATDDSATIEEDTSGTINVLDNDVNVINANITAINGAAIVNGGPALAVSHGTVLLTNSGIGSDHVIFTPAADYFGPAAFTYTVQDNLGRFATANVNVTVTNVEDAPTDIVFTGGTLVNENAANGTVISTLSTTDPDNTAVATNDTFTYTLADNFGGAFQIVGNQIRVQNGALLDFESGVISYALNVTTDDGHGGIFTKPLTITVKDVNEAPTDIIFNGNAATTAVSIAELPVSNAVATLTATDPDAAPNGAAGVTFGLADSADGRFSITGNQISLVNPALIDFENPNLPLHSFILQTTAKDAGGLARTEAFTVNVTNSVENVVAGATTGNNTLNGTAGNDIINGLAGRDTMSGLAGNDTYFVENSGDKITENTNAGNDTVYLQTLTSYGMDNNVENLIYLSAANATLRGTAINNAIVGGTGNDTIQGNDGNDHLIGNAGVDSLQGGNGNDRLYGSAGNDSLDGGNGNDWLEGGAGNDALLGGGGNDTFFFAGIFGADSIQSFGDVAGNQDLVAFSSNTVASYTALQSSMSQAGANVQINLVGVGSITLTNVTLGSLGADDFLFM